MSAQLPDDLIHSLYATLENLEQSFPDAPDASAMGELKRIILSRIADLQAARAVESATLH